MKNKYFPDEDITEDDLYFVCYMIERVARHIKQKNKYVVNTIGRDGFYHLLSCASALHCENPLKVEHDWIYRILDFQFLQLRLTFLVVQIIGNRFAFLPHRQVQA